MGSTCLGSSSEGNKERRDLEDAEERAHPFRRALELRDYCSLEGNQN